MPESLFAPRKFRRSYLVGCFAGALLLEASLVGVAAVWPQPKSFKIPEIVTELDAGPTDPVQELILPMEDPVPTPEMPTPPPEDTPEPDDTPPPPDEMDMTLETPKPTSTPAPKTKPKFVMPAGTPDPRAKRGPVPQNGVVGGVPSAARTAGPLPGGGGKGGGHVVTPKPPYPYQARAAHITGSGVCHVTFDGSGHVASATMTQSTGNGLLDSGTVSYARSNWSGPPNGAANVPITYRAP